MRKPYKFMVHNDAMMMSKKVRFSVGSDFFDALKDEPEEIIVRSKKLSLFERFKKWLQR